MERKRLTLIPFLALATILFIACGHKTSDGTTAEKKGSSGKTLEVLLAMDKPYSEQQATAELLDSTLRSRQLGLMNPEPRFDVVTIPVSSLKSTAMFQAHRNIILCDIDPSHTTAKIYIHHDQWAAPQAVVDIVAPSADAARELLAKHFSRIEDEFHNAERKRVIKAYHGLRNPDLMNRVEKHLGVSFTLGEEFSMTNLDDGFAWIRKETKDFSLGLLVNIEPYQRQQQFDSATILNRYDTIMRRHVPGYADSSYIGTERRFELPSRVVNFNNSKFCIETRGYWRTFGGYMGGPFVAYTLLSPDGTKVADLIGFIHSPRSDHYSKRDLLMQVEGICYSIKWAEK